MIQRFFTALPLSTGMQAEKPRGRARHTPADSDSDFARSAPSTARAYAARRGFEAEHRYRDIFENCAWGIFQTTADGRYLRANPALARIYDYDSPGTLLDALTDIGAQLYVDPRRRDDFRRVMRERRVVTNFESQVYRRDGSVIWIAETCRAVRSSAGKLLYYEGTVEDITERKYVENELRLAKEAAEAANHAKSEFLAVMSHELRTPLNAIIGFADIIRRQMLGPEAAARYIEYAGDIQRSGQRLLGIINDILDLTRADSAAAQTEVEIVDLSVVAGETADVLARIADDAGVMIAVCAEPVHVRGNATMLRRALLNLASNAIKFTPAGGCADIVIAAEPNDQARIEVRDTGIGIAAHEIDRVTEPFYQADSGLNRRHEGAGLGLTIADRIFRLHGGALSLASQPGHGTIATVRLPLAKPTADLRRRIG